MTKMKLSFINGGAEFELPVVNADSDIQLTIDLLKLQIKTERDVARDLNLDLKMVRRELLRKQMEERRAKDEGRMPDAKLTDLSEEAKDFNGVVAYQLNLDTVHHVLHLIDPMVTKEQVRSLGAMRLGRLVMDIFPPTASQETPSDPPAAAPLTAAASP